jgi:uncharacterized protein (TIGR02284 family)
VADNQHAIDVIEKLIEYARDGQNGWRDGAEHVKDPQLKKWMEEVSLQRAKMAGDLENEAIRLGKSDVDRSGSIEGAIHRGWTDLKANLGGGDDAILSSMETGDNYAVHGYEKHLQDNRLPDSLLSMMRTQVQSIRAALERVRTLRAQHKAA